MPCPPRHARGPPCQPLSCLTWRAGRLRLHGMTLHVTLMSMHYKLYSRHRMRQSVLKPMGSLTVGKKPVTKHPSQLQHAWGPSLERDRGRLPACSLVWRSRSEAALCSSSGPALDTSASSGPAGVTLLVVPWLLLNSGLHRHRDVRLSSVQEHCALGLLPGGGKKLRVAS